MSGRVRRVPGSLVDIVLASAVSISVVSAACLPTSIAVGAAKTKRERGAYLVETLAACAGCHTPRAATGPGPPLSGGNRYGPPQAIVQAPNITPDKTTGIGAWSDREIIDAIRLGIRPDGARIGPPMPQTAYRAMSDADAEAIVAYLRSLPPVAHSVPRLLDRATRRMPVQAATARDPLVGLRASGTSPDIVSRGRYIATALSHCAECHSSSPLGAPDLARRFDAGGRLFKTRDGTIVAPGIRAENLAGLSDDALGAIVTRGVRPDGSRLRGPMPVGSYGGFRKPDLAALIAFLRSDQHL